MSAVAKNDNSAVLLVIPLGFAIYSYTQKYSFGKGALVTVLGTLAVGVAVGIYSVASLTSKLVDKSYN
jgi:hypothetical protein